MGVRSLAIGNRTLPCANEAFAAMKPETRAALENPASETWHDASVVIDSAEALQRLTGDAGVEAMNYAAVKKSLGPIMAPFLTIALTLFGMAPDVILKCTFRPYARSSSRVRGRNFSRLIKEVICPARVGPDPGR